MKLQPRARTGIALIAAYAVALQALLLAVIAPSAGIVTGIVIGSLPGLAEAAALPLCASSANHSTPGGHGQDCLDACLTGCCCGAPLLPTPTAAVFFAPTVARILTSPPTVGHPAAVRAGKAHRSRAPPLT